MWQRHRTTLGGTRILGGKNTAHNFLMGETIGVEKKHIWGGGTPNILCLWGELLGWGHRTTLKEKASH